MDTTVESHQAAMDYLWSQAYKDSFGFEPFAETLSFKLIFRPKVLDCLRQLNYSPYPVNVLKIPIGEQVYLFKRIKVISAEVQNGIVTVKCRYTCWPELMV